MPPEQTSPPAAQPPMPVPVPPDLLAWARQTFDEREYREGVRDILATGGHSLESVLAEVEAVVRGS